MPRSRPLASILAAVALAVPASAQEPRRGSAPAAASVLFANVRVFDGKSPRVGEPTEVLVTGDRIARIGRDVPSFFSSGVSVLDERVELPAVGRGGSATPLGTAGTPFANFPDKLHP